MNFNVVKEQLIKSLESIPIDLGEPVTLIDGFMQLSCSSELTNESPLEGPTIPVVTLLGESGQLYFFALYALLN